MKRKLTSATLYVFVMICIMIHLKKQRRVKGAEVLTVALTMDERLNAFRRRRTFHGVQVRSILK